MAQQSIAITTLPDGKICDFNELPRSKLRGIKPPLADSHGPASLAGSYSWSVWMACRRPLEHPQLDILTMQLRIGLFTALLPPILADDGFIPVTAYRTDEGAFGPQLAPHKRFLTVGTR